MLTQNELMRLSRIELMALLRRIAAELPDLPANSPELRIAHVNLHEIRRALPLPSVAPRP